VKKVYDLMQQGVADGVFPGAVLLVAHQGRVLFSDAFGLARLSPERPMTIDTVFDLASLTKPLATTLALMLLVQETKLDLDQGLGSTISYFLGTDKEHVTVRQLLSHTSGLPDYRPYYEELSRIEPSERKDALKSLLLAEPLIHKPGQVSLYSDLDFMILEWLIDNVAKQPLDRFVGESVYKPLRLNHLFFVPLFDGKKRNGLSYAATENCPWRKEIVEGKVHDDNAYVIGGVGGHAGLFGTAQDVHVLLQELLNTWSGTSNRGLFEGDVLRTFFERQSDAGSWALGFDTPTRPDSSSGKYFSDQSVGHLGFTGTSFWMDLEKEVILILLTNRIHPTRENERIKEFRPLLHDTVMEAILSTAA
jgi:CubicO group peptidase (beta-lactamase class C family)